ncbi:hypothetical protein GW17_00029212, partial [Ensete ventricosum]
ESTGTSLDDCLKLLRGQRDEQKLAGLLLAAKFCQGGDTASVLKVYEAVGARFLQRLLMTGNILEYLMSDPFIVEECYEFLLLVAAASENGLVKFYEPGVMDMLAPHISTLTDGIK